MHKGNMLLWVFLIDVVIIKKKKVVLFTGEFTIILNFELRIGR